MLFRSCHQNHIDETDVHEDSSENYLLEDIGKIKKVRKQLRGISKQDLYFSCDSCKCFDRIHTVNQMNLTRTMYKSNTETSYAKLEPINQFCARLKFFIDKHLGFKKGLVQDYLNLFILIDSEKKDDGDLFKITIQLLKMMCEQLKVA